MKTDACPKCGSTEREPGEIFPKGSLWDVTFEPAARFRIESEKEGRRFGLFIMRLYRALPC